jgi:hypothetical protein
VFAILHGEVTASRFADMFAKPPPRAERVDECPDDIEGAIEFAEERRIDEALASYGFLSSLAA